MHTLDNTIDATPPADFPAQVVMMDSELAARLPAEGFYLRVARTVGGEVDEAIRLTGAYTVPDARRLAIKMGYAPTHWMDVRAMAPSQF